eukprot:3576214-Rhodomonas_salina.3
MSSCHLPPPPPRSGGVRAGVHAKLSERKRGRRCVGTRCAHRARDHRMCSFPRHTHEFEGPTSHAVRRERKTRGH